MFRLTRHQLHGVDYVVHALLEVHLSFGGLFLNAAFIRGLRVITVAFSVCVSRSPELALDRCVGELFSKTEQVAFYTSDSVVPGIGFSENLLMRGEL